jgi:putative transposase
LDGAATEDWLGKTAVNLMLIGVATRKIGRAVRLPEGPLPRVDRDGTSKSAASRRFVALSQARMETWLKSDLSKLDLLVIQIDGLHVAEDIVLIGAIGIDEGPCPSRVRLSAGPPGPAGQRIPAWGH